MKLPQELQFIANDRMIQKNTEARLDGHTCVITGAPSGGYQAAKRMVQGGANLILVCRNPEKGAGIQDELHGKYGSVIQTMEADFSRLEDVRKCPAAILEKTPRIDVLINNAATGACKVMALPRRHSSSRSGNWQKG